MMEYRRPGITWSSLTMSPAMASATPLASLRSALLVDFYMCVFWGVYFCSIGIER